MPKQFLGYRRADGCPQKNQGEDISQQSYSGGDRHVDKVLHSGGDTPTSSRISAQSNRPTHIYPQPSSHQTTDHINTYQKTSTSVAAATHSSMSTVPNILTSTGIIGNNLENVKTSSTSSTSVIGHSSPAYSVHMQQFRPQGVLHLSTTIGASETTTTAQPISLNVNSTFRGGGVGSGGGGGGSSTEGQATSTTHHTPTFTSHLPRGAAAASALSVPKPGSSIASVATPAAVMRPNTPTIISNTGYSQINRASLISTIKQTTPPSSVRAGQSGVAPASQIILRPEKPRSGIYGDGTTVVPAAPSTQNIQIMLKKTRGADVTKSQVMPGHCSAKAVPVTPSISHTSLTTAVTSKVIASSQGSLTPLAPNLPIKQGGGKWNCGNHLVDLTKETSKPMNAKALAAISMSTQVATSSSGSVTQATAAVAAVTSATSSIPSSIPIAKVTPQRQQASSHITQAAAAAAAAAAAPHPIVQEARTETQPHGQPAQTAVSSNYFIPAQASRVSASSTPLTTNISAGTPTVTHADNRQDGRSTVQHMQSYIPPELIYNMPYSLIPYQMNTNVPVRSSLCGTISTQAVVTSAADIVSCSAATSVSILSVNNSLAVGNVMQPTPSNLANNTVTLSSNNSSPRPSILRKRTNDGTAVGVKKTFGLQSSSIENTQSPRQESTPQSNTSSPKTPAGDNSQSSTDTALSTEAGCTGVPTSASDNRNPSECSDSHEQNGVVSSSILSTPSVLPNLSNSVEASPRKKPRKQMLNANEELKDNTSTDEEYDKLGKLEELKDYKNRDLKDEYTDEEGVRWTTEKLRTKLSLLKCYVRTWKVRANHFERHSDVKCKEDKRATVSELSNQRGVLQKASGWKLYFLATQLEDMNEMEKTICNQMCKLQKTISPKDSPKQGTMDSDETKLHELTQANIQRCKLVIDQLTEARSSMLKILDHKQHVLDIINKHISKRPIKKKERT